jgi:hypothetical protein
VALQPCVIYGRQPSDPDHLRFAQPRAIGLKVSDEFTVPLCRGHHHQLHRTGNEVAWWEKLQIEAVRLPEPFGCKPTPRRPPKLASNNGSARQNNTTHALKPACADDQMSANDRKRHIGGTKVDLGPTRCREP